MGSLFLSLLRIPKTHSLSLSLSHSFEQRTDGYRTDYWQNVYECVSVKCDRLYAKMSQKVFSFLLSDN